MPDEQLDAPVEPSSPPAPTVEFHDDDELADALAGELAAVTRTEGIPIQRVVQTPARAAEPVPPPRGVASGRIERSSVAVPSPTPDARALDIAPPLPVPALPVPLEPERPAAEPLAAQPPAVRPPAAEARPAAAETPPTQPTPAAAPKPRRSVIEAALRAARRDGIPTLRQSATPPVMVSGPVPARRRASDSAPEPERPAVPPASATTADGAAPATGGMQPVQDYDADGGTPTVAMPLPELEPYPGWELALRAVALPSAELRPAASSGQAAGQQTLPPAPASGAGIAQAAVAGAVAGAPADAALPRRGSRRALRARVDTGPIPQQTWALSQEDSDAAGGDVAAAFAPLVETPAPQPRRLSRRALRAAERAAEELAEGAAVSEPQRYQQALLGDSAVLAPAAWSEPNPAPSTDSHATEQEWGEPEWTTAVEQAEPVPAARRDAASQQAFSAAEPPTVAFAPPADGEAAPTMIMPATDPSMIVHQRAEPETTLLPAAPAAAPTRSARSSSGFATTFGVTAGTVAAPIALVVGSIVGGGAAGALALLAGVLLAAPATARQAGASARLGTGTVGVQRAVFGSAGGGVVACLLFVARIAAGVLALQLVGRIGKAIAVHAGVTAALASLPGLLLSLGVGALGTAMVLWRRRFTNVLLLVGGVAAVLVTLSLLLLLPLRASNAAVADPGGVDVGGALVVGFVAIGLLVATGVADLAGGGLRSSSGAATAVGAVAGALIGALAAAAGIVVVADALIGGLTVSVPAGVVGVAVGVGCAALLGAILRSAGSMLADGLGGPVPIGVLISGLLVIAGTLAVPFTELSFEDLVRLYGPIVAVPVVAWAGVVSAAPARVARTRISGAFVAVLIATVAGLVLLDGVVTPGERSGLLDLFGLPVASAWRADCIVPLAAALVIGVVGGSVADLVRRPARGHAAAADSLQA